MDKERRKVEAAVFLLTNERPQFSNSQITVMWAYLKMFMDVINEAVKTGGGE